MWKNFFHFNRGQRIGILFLLTLIVLTLFLFWLIPYFFQPKTEVADTGFLKEAAQFRESLVEMERTKKRNYEDFDTYYKPFPKRTFAETKYELFEFDPNTADSATFVRLGLKPYIAKNILKYRSKGGKFRKPDDFANVYGLSSVKMDELKPFITLEETTEIQMVDNAAETTKAGSEPGKLTLNSNVPVELNSADTAALVWITGIGRSTAKGIAGYRRVLGGYYSVEQLKEIYGMRPENFEKIKSNFTIDASLIKKINVNTASVERLKSHPYIKTFQKAKAIYEYRRKKVTLNSIDDLKVLDELNEEDLNRLKPYLEFN